jgi:Ca-activated chloride channel homolog
MKGLRFIRSSRVVLGIGFAFQIAAFAQEGASSASVSRTRALSTSGTTSANSTSSSTGSGNNTYYNRLTFTPPDAVAVEEFVNYHKHRLAEPKSGEAVALDTRWGSNEISALQPEAVLQIGLSTAEVNERTDLRPLNLALVIDRSGSMGDDDKLSRVKESLKAMVGKLRENDIVSIVVFDTDAQVLLPAAPLGDGFAVRRAIDCIQPNGSTNLDAGLMLGYREAQKNYLKGPTNRVILLTDGIANVGVVDPGRIASRSSEYNGQGIDLSTIGVGRDLNNDLLRELAASGRGLYHFVSDYKDIDKVFVNEVQSLISSVAKNARISVDHDSNLVIEQIYGYQPHPRKNGATIDLDNMNSGLTQVVMMRVRVKDPSKPVTTARVQLSYFDIKKQKVVVENQQLSLNSIGRGTAHLLDDVEVKKNYTIAELAQSLHDMTDEAKQGRYRAAENLVNQSVASAYSRYPNMEDTNIRFVLNIVENYKTSLAAYNRQTGNGDCGTCR